MVTLESDPAPDPPKTLNETAATALVFVMFGSEVAVTAMLPLLAVTWEGSM